MPADYGHELTDAELDALEKRIREVYRQAQEELQKAVDDYFSSFWERDAKMRARVESGDMTVADYREWRLAQIGRGERFEALRDEMAERYTYANEIAIRYINDKTPGIYTLNRNYMAYTIEQVVGDIGFTLFDEQTVRWLILTHPNLMPNYPALRAVKRGIDLAWGKKQITAAVTSGILQGSSLKRVADDLQKRISTMNRDSALRTARTALTGAENAGRLDSLSAAQKRGIPLKKEWVAVMDSRTRHAHAVLDGQKADINKPFKVDGQEIMYPGDPHAKGYLVYNCRCTLVGSIQGVREAEAPTRRARNPETGKSERIDDMSYAEWEKQKRGKSVTDDPLTSYKKDDTINSKTFNVFHSGDEVNDFFYFDDENRGLSARKSSLHGMWRDGLSEDEEKAISWYTADGYGDINDYWRKRNGWEYIPKELVEDASAQIDKAIARFDLKENITVYRGVADFFGGSIVEQEPWEDIREIIGKTFHDLGYGSSTVLCGNSVAAAKPVLFEIEIPAGIGRGAYVNKLAGLNEDVEYEFLIARGSKFKVTDVVINEEPIPAQTIIKMRMIVDA